MVQLGHDQVVSEWPYGGGLWSQEQVSRANSVDKNGYHIIIHRRVGKGSTRAACAINVVS